ncbi:MAG: M3 family oligoendopeptidase [Anaerolineae bacterium]|nr:M3 family oligoendopeptidase [Anaerolineae bacterium]
MFESLPKSAQQVQDWSAEQYQPYFQDLIDRPLNADNVSAWLADWTRIAELAGEVFSRLNLATSQDTTDEDAEKRFLAFSEHVLPALQVADQELKEKLLASGLQPDGFEIPLRNMRVEAEIFREANLPLMVEERKLGVQFDKITGGMTVNWKGEEKPLPALQTEGQNPDRAEREKAWRAAHQRFLADRERINELWGKFLDVRLQMARNAGYDSYIPFRWKQMGRFDYTPEDCLSFHRAIEEAVVPAAERLYERRRQQLGVSTLRPWDLNVDPTHPSSIVLDPLGREPLHPYQSVEEMERTTEAIFQHVDPALGGYFTTMRREGLLDLGSRKNKAPGGFCTSFPVQKRPFIFMNAVGLHDDVQTLLHEAGHAFHVFESAPLPYAQQHDTPIEFAEVASMGMELLAAPYLTQNYGGYYNETDAARARIEHLEGMITFWPYMAVVDAFQHWVYNNIAAAHDPAACDAKWAELWGRFMRGMDWSGLDEELRTGWHRKLHIHQIPFYYVEYGLAQLGAAQVWRGSLEDQAGAVARYRKALALGGVAALPRLYETAGARFAFDTATLRSAVDLIEATIERLSAVH